MITRVLDRHSDLITDPTSDEHSQYRYTIVESRLLQGGVTHYCVPEVEFSSVTTIGLSANVLYYSPFLTHTSLILSGLAAEVATGSSANGKARLGVYACDTDFQPTTLVVDGGEVAIDSSGIKTASINTTLAPGNYVTALHVGAACTFRMLRGGNSLTGVSPNFGTNTMNYLFSVSLAFGNPFGATGTAYTAIGVNTRPFYHFVTLGISA